MQFVVLLEYNVALGTDKSVLKYALNSFTKYGIVEQMIQTFLIIQYAKGLPRNKLARSVISLKLNSVIDMEL